MDDLGLWAALAILAVGLVALGWWLFIETEGVYLGRRIVVWLYDLYAGRYDDIKHFRQEYDHQFLAQPIVELIAPHRAPLVLDVATGTARLPLALLRHAQFQGRVVGLDLSRRMLGFAAAKLDGDPRAPLIWAPAEALPFPDSTFDVVTSLESLEFMANPDAALREMVRVLRPGGLLLVTNRINTRWMPGKTHTDEEMAARLEALGLDEVVVDRWQVDYNRVFGWKAGESSTAGARPLGEILRCPRCKERLLVEYGGRWTCPAGHYTAAPGPDGVIEIGAG